MNIHCSRKQFSLIELLVVIAIIGILASLVMPALGKARKTSQVAVCTSNLKQINTAVFIYHDDSEGYYPPSHISDGTSWDDLLGDYDGRGLTAAEKTAGGYWGATTASLGGGNLRGDLYRCPLDDRTRTDDYLTKSYSHTQAWFSVNGAVWAPGAGVAGASYNNPTGNNIQPYSRSVTSMTAPSQTIAYTGLVDDLVQATAFDNNHIRSRLGTSWLWGGVRPDHQENMGESHHPQNKFNYAMADGSIQKMTTIQSLLRLDGSGVAASSNVIGTKWDATK